MTTQAEELSVYVHDESPQCPVTDLPLPLPLTISPPTNAENLAKIQGTLLNIVDCFSYQIFGNIDSFMSGVCNEFPNADRQKMDKLKYLLESMVKQPIHRQLNRVRSVANNAIPEFITKLPRSETHGQST